MKTVIVYVHVFCVVGAPAKTGQMDRRHDRERRWKRHERLLANVLVEKESLLTIFSGKEKSVKLPLR